jgi:branched-chain amino acid transport system ATP-binding protein
MALLEVQDVHTYYGNIHALKGVSVEVDEGEIVTLIGANGAGKSTTLKTISGLTPPTHGRVILEGQDITDIPAHEIVQKGVVQAPEGRKVFTRLTVRENLLAGAYARTDTDNFQGDMERLFETFPVLAERINQLGGTLSGGEQQMLATARALMGRPRVLLLDEPSMGLAPMLVRDIFRIISELNEQGTTILLVEQNAHMALGTASRGYVIQTGEIVLADNSDGLRQNEMVRKAYLGEE